MANETVTIPANLRAKAKDKNWPDDLVQQALAAGATPDQLIGYLDNGITPTQANQNRKLRRRPRRRGAPNGEARRGRADPGRRGNGLLHITKEGSLERVVRAAL